MTVDCFTVRAGSSSRVRAGRSKHAPAASRSLNARAKHHVRRRQVCTLRVLQTDGRALVTLLCQCCHGVPQRFTEFFTCGLVTISFSAASKRCRCRTWRRFQVSPQHLQHMNPSLLAVLRSAGRRACSLTCLCTPVTVPRQARRRMHHT